MSEENDETDGIYLTSRDLLELVTILADAVVRQGTAIRHLTNGENPDARRAMQEYGEQIDEFLAVIERKLGPQVMIRER